ncbi:MAG TPA: hypothetical protein VED01_13885 [Burkholderiales bacterium]|nr:hypothetical protein [Burkholderiales bacterium]
MMKHRFTAAGLTLLAASTLAVTQAQANEPGITGVHGTQASASSRSSVSLTPDARGSVSTRAGGTLSPAGDATLVDSDVDAVAGGVGINARARLSSEARPDHNVKMVFALNTGNYVADVQVKVKDASGRTVIDGVANGPWLYARLPAGSYTAVATYSGHTVTEQFTVARTGLRSAILRWPASVEQQTAAISPILGTGPQNEPASVR